MQVSYISMEEFEAAQFSEALEEYMADAAEQAGE